MITTTPTWKLILNCAQGLTAEGNVPFTRKQLIECVRLKDPARLPGTINSIIQGMTGNLKGGPDGRGRGALRSVGRGQFVLTTSGEVSLEASVKKPEFAPTLQTFHSSDTKAVPSRTIAGIDFQGICELAAEREPDGAIRLFKPQSRYANEGGLGLNQYGAGPFCRFKIPANLPLAGVYAITGDKALLYIGECENLSRRFNYGYGLISPRNCFKGGQETNCRINTLVLKEMQAGRALHLYFHRCDNYKQLEAKLRRDLKPQWNRI